MGARSGGGGGIQGATVGELGGGSVPAIGVESGGDLGLLDDVFEDALDVGGGGGGEEIVATSGVGILEVSYTEGVVCGGSTTVGTGGDGTDLEVMDLESVGGEIGATTAKDEGAGIAIGGDNSVAEFVELVERGNNNTLSGTTGEINTIVEDGGGVSVGGGNRLGGGDGATGGIDIDVEGVGGVSVGGGDGFGGDDGIGGGGVGDNGSTVEPIPLIPRWRLREILAHAEGECILLLC